MSFNKTIGAALISGLMALSVVPATAASTVKSGTFKGSGSVNTAGSVSVVKSGSTQTIVLSKNFTTKRGPSLWVYIGNGKPSKRIGKLQAVKGTQSYKLPAGLNIKDYANVYIYCRPFRKVFGSAKLR